MSGFGGQSIYCIVIAALHYNSGHKKKGCPAGQPHKNIGTFGYFFFQIIRRQRASPLPQRNKIFPKEQRQNVQNSQIVGSFEAGRRLRVRSILGVCEQPEIKPDAERATICGFLPDNHSFIFWQIHRAVGNTKRLVEGVDIAQGDVYAVAAE